MFLDNKFYLIFPLNFHLFLIFFNFLTPQLECFLFEPDSLIGRCLQLNFKLCRSVHFPPRFGLQRHHFFLMCQSLLTQTLVDELLILHSLLSLLLLVLAFVLGELV